MEKSSRIPTAIAEALERYENIRDSVYKELGIKHVQNSVTNKLLNTENKELELLFYKDKEDLGQDLFVSEDGPTVSIGSSEKEESNWSKIATESVSSEAKDCPLTSEENRKERNATPGTNKYLDLDAEYSGDEEAEDELDDEDANSMIDNSCDNNIDLGKYTKEMEIKDKKQLQDLKNKFFKKRVVKDASLEDVQTRYVLEDSADEFPEIQEFEFFNETSNFEEDTQNADRREINEYNDYQEKKIIVDDGSFFNNQSIALERLTRKDNVKNIGFFEKESKS